jgi:hypothetical protein
VDADLDTLVTALYVKIDDMLVKDRRPEVTEYQARGVSPISSAH